MIKKFFTLFLMTFCLVTVANSQRSEYYDELMGHYSKCNKKSVILIKASGFMTFGTDLLNDGGAFGGDYCFGINTDFYLKSGILLGSGLEFVTRTYDYEEYATFIGRYISIPFNISGRGENFYIKTGTHFDFNVSKTTKVEDKEIDVDDLYNTFRMGLHLEFGFCGWDHFDVGVLIGWNFTNFLQYDFVGDNLNDWNLGVVAAYKF